MESTDWWIIVMAINDPLLKATVSGLKETMEGMGAISLGIQPGIRKMIEDLTEQAAEGMRSRAPTWRGQLRESITAEYGRESDVVWGTARTGVSWAAPQEFGTGMKGPMGKTYFPNPTNLEAWAVEHGFESGWHLAVVIAKMGKNPGTEATTFTAETMVELIRGLPLFTDYLPLRGRKKDKGRTIEYGVPTTETHVPPGM